jgi:hypothetical protein
MKAAAAIFLCMLGCAPAAALADDAAPAILSPAPGAVVTSPVTVTISPGGGSAAMDMAMPGMSGMAHGHLHLIIDAPLPPTGAHIPMDKRHLHLMHGETSKTISLPPGQHTIQLIAGSAGHAVPKDAAHSDPVTFTVK